MPWMTPDALDRERIVRDVARGGQVDLLAQLLEQGQAGMAFQLADLRGHGRLREVQFLARGAKARPPGHGFEGAQRSHAKRALSDGTHDD